MRSNKMVYMIVGLVVILYLGMPVYGARTDVVAKVKAGFSIDKYGNVLVAVDYKIKKDHAKYGYEDICKGSVWLECLTSYDSKGERFRKVVNSCHREGLVDKEDKSKMTCFVEKSLIPAKGYFMWVRLKIKVGDHTETHLIKAGKIK